MHRTDRQTWRYVLIPKGLGGLLFKFSYYLPSTLLVLISRHAKIGICVEAVVAMVFIEGMFGTSRKVLNDVRDYSEDLLRGHRWTPSFAASDRAAIVWTLALKVI